IARPADQSDQDYNETGNTSEDCHHGQCERGRHVAGSESFGVIVNAIGVKIVKVSIVRDFFSRRIDLVSRGAPILSAQRWKSATIPLDCREIRAGVKFLNR